MGINKQEIQIKIATIQDQKDIIQFDKQKFFKNTSFLGNTTIGKPIQNSYTSTSAVGYKFGEVILCTYQSIILARVSLGTKSVFFDGKPQKAGYIFDFQVLGNIIKDLDDLKDILQELIEEIQKIAKDKHKCDIIYLANKFNDYDKIEKIILDLFLKDFSKSQERQIGICSILQNTSEEDTISWNIQLKNQQFAAYKQLIEHNKIIEYMGNQDGEQSNFYLQEPRYDFFPNENFKGTFIYTTTDKENIAGISIFEEPNKLNPKYLKFLYLKPDIFNSDYFNIFTYTVTGIILLVFTLLLIQMNVHYFVAFGFLLAAYFFIQYKIERMINDMNYVQKPYLRFVAPFYKGNPDLEDELFQNLIKNLILEKQFQIYPHVRINLEKNNSLIKHFYNKNGFSIINASPTYLVKSLSDKIQNVEEVLQKNDKFFLDPRDI